MDIIFENSYARNREVLKETNRYLLFCRPVFIILDILMALLLLMSVFNSLYFWRFDFRLLLYFCVYIFIRIFPYFNSIRITLKRDAEALGGSPVKIHTEVTDTSIILTASTGSKNEFQLTSIKKVVQTKNLILLRTKANLLLTFRKDSFTVGSSEEFLSFLADKGIQ